MLSSVNRKNKIKNRRMKTAETLLTEGLEFLKMHGIEFEANCTAKRLRLLAVKYSSKVVAEKKPIAVFLSGSSVVGNSGRGSDIDVDVIVSSASKPIRKLHFEGTPVDLAVTSVKEWRNFYLEGDNLRYLTHSIPLYVQNSNILSDWQNAIRHYYSSASYAKEYGRVCRIVSERSKTIDYYCAHDRLFLSILPIESCFFEVVNLFIYKNRGCPSNSTMLEEFH